MRPSPFPVASNPDVSGSGTLTSAGSWTGSGLLGRGPAAPCMESGGHRGEAINRPGRLARGIHADSRAVDDEAGGLKRLRAGTEALHRSTRLREGKCRAEVCLPCSLTDRHRPLSQMNIPERTVGRGARICPTFRDLFEDVERILSVEDGRADALPVGIGRAAGVHRLTVGERDERLAGARLDCGCPVGAPCAGKSSPAIG